MTLDQLLQELPPPWRIIEYDHGWTVETRSGLGICSLHKNTDTSAWPRQEDQLRAIAAIPDMVKLLGAASHALRSYQYANAAPDLAKDIADKIDEVLGAPTDENHVQRPHPAP